MQDGENLTPAEWGRRFEAMANVGSPDPQVTTEIAVQLPAEPAPAALTIAAAPLRKLKAYLLEPADQRHKEVARFEFEGVELPKVIVWWKDTFVREGTTSLYRRASAVFMNWGEEPAK